MLHTVNEHEMGVVIDLVDDSVVAAAGRPQPGELADERLTDAVGIVSECAEHQRDGRRADLRRESVEMSDRLWRQLDLVHQSSAGQVIAQPGALTAGCLVS